MIQGNSTFRKDLKVIISINQLVQWHSQSLSGKERVLITFLDTNLQISGWNGI